jgi:hypothetical protein
MALSGEREGPREKHYLFTTLHIVPSTRQRLISHTSHTDNLFLYHVSSHFHTYFPPLSSPILVCFGWTMKVGGGPYSLSQPHCLFLAQLYIHMRLRILLRFDASLDRQTQNTHTHPLKRTYRSIECRSSLSRSRRCGERIADTHS